MFVSFLFPSHDPNGETLEMPSIKRGTERYYKRTYARIQPHLAHFDSIKTKTTQTSQKTTYKGITRKTWLTNTIFVTQTYSQENKLQNSWINLGADFNRWLSKIRKKYPIHHYIRVWETQKNGYPHIHCLIKFKQQFKAIKLGKHLRILNRKQLQFNQGFIDIKGVLNPKQAIKYITKYITKVYNPKSETPQNILNQTMQWIYRKRSWSGTRLKKPDKSTNNGELSILQTTNGLNKDGTYQVESKDSWKITGFKDKNDTIYEISSGLPDKSEYIKTQITKHIQRLQNLNKSL